MSSQSAQSSQSNLKSLIGVSDTKDRTIFFLMENLCDPSGEMEAHYS